MPGYIVPMGAGRAVMDRRTDPLHDYVLALPDMDNPVVLFVPTATRDDASYTVSFYEAFHSRRCPSPNLLGAEAEPAVGAATASRIVDNPR
jgi:hypothetical protein